MLRIRNFHPSGKPEDLNILILGNRTPPHARPSTNSALHGKVYQILLLRLSSFHGMETASASHDAISGHSPDIPHSAAARRSYIWPS